jgi:hypothetical protein
MLLVFDMPQPVTTGGSNYALRDTQIDLGTLTPVLGLEAGFSPNLR